MRILQIGMVVVAGLLGVLIGLMLSDTPQGIDQAANDPITDEQFAERVRATLVEQPEILQEAFYVLETRTRQDEMASLQDAITRNYNLIESAPAVIIGGNPDGDVVVVEFFDYECGYCRRAQPEFEELIASDGNIKVIYYEMPILGEQSYRAAQVALAADAQGLYAPFHHAAMAMAERLTDEVIFAIAAEVGLDIDQLMTDLQDPALGERLNANLQFARAMQINSTPTYIVGGRAVLGWNEEQIQAHLTDARGR